MGNECLAQVPMDTFSYYEEWKSVQEKEKCRAHCEQIRQNTILVVTRERGVIYETVKHFTHRDVFQIVNQTVDACVHMEIMISGVRAARSSIIFRIRVHFCCGHTRPIRYAYKANIEEWDQCPSTFITVQCWCQSSVCPLFQRTFYIQATPMCISKIFRLCYSILLVR